MWVFGLREDFETPRKEKYLWWATVVLCSCTAEIGAIMRHYWAGCNEHVITFFMVWFDPSHPMKWVWIKPKWSSKCLRQSNTRHIWDGQRSERASTDIWAMVADNNNYGGNGKCWNVGAFNRSSGVMGHSLITFANKTARSAAAETLSVSVRLIAFYLWKAVKEEAERCKNRRYSYCSAIQKTEFLSRTIIVYGDLYGYEHRLQLRRLRGCR